MKTKITLLSLVASSLAFGQLKTPQASPLSKIEQTIGLTTISVEYSRPSKNGRNVFSDVVKLDQVWRTGANENTKFSTSDILIFDKDTLQAGEYALYTKPMKDSWKIYFYKETTNWGTPEKWEENKVALSITTPSVQLENTVETFTIQFNNLTTKSGHLSLMWDKTAISIPFQLNTVDEVVANINKIMNGPSSRDYYGAANYYFSEGMDLDQALVWMKKAVELEGERAFWMYRKLALIQAKKGAYKEAIESAQVSIEGATKVGNMNYVEMNNISIKEWKEILKK
jgi:tetratricopeptide (TPR) repeat protein